MNTPRFRELPPELREVRAPETGSSPFLGADAPQAVAAAARALILPLPFERTTSYGKGTAAGPAAILAASAQVELWDQELGLEPADYGVCTLPEFRPRSEDLEAAMGELAAAAEPLIAAGKWLVSLGGEHSLTLGPVRAAKQVYGDLGILQFDAHADLRDSYEGTAHSHACIMRRLLDLGCPTGAIGLRSLSRPEAALIRERDLPVIWARQLDRAEELLDQLLDRLPQRIYLTFDVDFFDPAILPATGTPEPGGGLWYPTLRLLRKVFAQKEVVAMDVVELAPRAEAPASDFIAAKLIYKCLGYRFLGTDIG